ncbi:hypothetical protein NDU88_009013 [Pleurodeles waltl]|uniref:Uncharacterized protein n=1 Tax=Pleurodeles waltl TaxID=8319 RepID=A0AAV7QWF5_PLEWA|nr:hypothetical protein NDU88_009013 [Pleurodeles waltl]
MLRPAPLFHRLSAAGREKHLARPPLIRCPLRQLASQCSRPDLNLLPPLQPPAPLATSSPSMGIEGVLADIRKSLSALAPTSPPGAPPTPLPGVGLPAPSVAAPARVPEQQTQTQDLSRLALLEVSRLLASINPPASNSQPPATPWGLSDTLQNSLHGLKRQVEALAAAHTSNPLQASVNSPSVTQTPGAVLASSPIVQNVLPSSSKALGQDDHTKERTTDALLSRPGKLAAHFSTEVKEKIWKGEFVDIFSLIRAKRREVETKEKEPTSSSYAERKPKIEESITNWLFGFNVFMSILLEKKTELGTSLIYYANKIVKAQHTYGGSAWLEYDRDFR